MAAQLAPIGGHRKQFLRLFAGQLIWGDGIGDVGSLHRRGGGVRVNGPFQVGSVPSHPHVHGNSIGIIKKVQRVDFSRIQGFQILLNEPFQAALARH